MTRHVRRLADGGYRMKLVVGSCVLGVFHADSLGVEGGGAARTFPSRSPVA